MRRIMGSLRLWGFCASVLVTVACAVDDGPTARSRHVLVVGWDGARADAVLVAETPTLDAMCATGACAFDATTQLAYMGLLPAPDLDGRVQGLISSQLDFSEGRP